MPVLSLRSWWSSFAVMPHAAPGLDVGLHSHPSRGWRCANDVAAVPFRLCCWDLDVIRITAIERPNVCILFAAFRRGWHCVVVRLMHDTNPLAKERTVEPWIFRNLHQRVPCICHLLSWFDELGRRFRIEVALVSGLRRCQSTESSFYRGQRAGIATSRGF